MAEPVDVPDLVRTRALSLGEAGQRWLDGLPDLVADLAARWELVLGSAYSGGTASYVVAATDAAGVECVLKIATPLDLDENDAFARAVAAHQLADGRGCARLLATDPDVPAMLIERLGPNLHDLDLAVPDVLDAVADTLVAFWRPVPDDVALPTGAQQATRLTRYIADTWARLGRPCPRPVVDRALALCGRRAAADDPATAVLVHGDAHGWNTLQSADGWKFVDPEGLRSQPAHDLGVLIREYNVPLLDGDTPRLVRERAEHVADRAGGVDPDAVWEWGFIERVSTGLATIAELDGGGGDAFLEVAERCL